MNTAQFLDAATVLYLINFAHFGAFAATLVGLRIARGGKRIAVTAFLDAVTVLHLPDSMHFIAFAAALVGLRIARGGKRIITSVLSWLVLQVASRRCWDLVLMSAAMLMQIRYSP